MYLTFYTNNIRQQRNNLNYNNIMQDAIEPTITSYKCTIETSQTPITQLSEKMTEHLHRLFAGITLMWRFLEPFKDNYTEQYTVFHIPKRTGGLRTIHAPNPEFKEALSKCKDVFENIIKCLPHDAAYAYIKNRSTTDALKKHQLNQSKWYLKLDIQDFFPNCTPGFIYNQLKQVFPFCYLETNRPDLCEILKEIIKICCLDNGLPQGTPMSPILTNLIMIPFDHKITQYLKRGTGNHYVYTRYADDILISSKSNFNWQELVSTLKGVLQPQFTIKDEKTRYGSTAGRNWNLGLMVNKDNQITLGHKKKKLLHAMLNNFLKDYASANHWSKEDTYTLQGQLGYLKHIEPNYYQEMLNKYETKYHINYKLAVKYILNN